MRLLSNKVDVEMLFQEDKEALKTCEQMRILVDRPGFKATGHVRQIVLDILSAYMNEHDSSLLPPADSAPK